MTNKVKMDYLNPYAKIKKANYKKAQEENIKNKDANRKARLAKKKEHRKKGRQFIIKYHKELEGANEETIKNYKEYILSTKVGKEALKQHEKLEEEKE